MSAYKRARVRDDDLGCGRKRMFLVGVGPFTAASAVAALAPSADWLIVAQARTSPAIVGALVLAASSLAAFDG